MLGGLRATVEAVQDYKVTTFEVGNLMSVMMIAVIMAVVMATLEKVGMEATEVQMYQQRHE